MRLVVPYTEILEPVSQSLADSPIEAEWVRMSSANSYNELLKQLWAAQETFIIIEHDNVVLPGTIQKFIECNKPWCANAYVVGGGIACALGCTKFDSILMQQEPNLFDDIVELWHYQELIIRKLARLGYEWHEHKPLIHHLNPGLKYLYSVLDLK